MYQSIGSFHSDNINELLKRAELPIRHPFSVESNAPSAERFKTIPFGANEYRSQYYMLDSTWNFLNHGAFGACTQYAFELSTEWRRHIEKQPLRFMDRELMPFLASSIKSLCVFINADVHDTVLLQNATTGLNAVIQSLPVEEHETILCFDTSYGSVKKMLQHKCDERSARLHQIPFQRFTSKEEMAMLLQETIDGLPNKISFILLDHVSSNTGLTFPLEVLVPICRKHDIPVVIDGAHGPLNLPLNLDTLKADYYVGNCHKWLSSPKGCAFLHVHPLAKCKNIRPCIISHGYDDGFSNAFLWDGLRDTTAALTIADCIAQWEVLGTDRVRQYIHQLVYDAGHLLADMWQTELLYDRPFISSMALVRLPFSTGNDTSNDAKAVQDRLHYDHQTEVPIKAIDGNLYVRISGHIYNKLSDYEKLGSVVNNWL